MADPMSLPGLGGLPGMGSVTCDVTVPMDGFVAGPRQSLENPVGEGGGSLHEWIFDPSVEDQAAIEAWQQRPLAYIMGRNIFGPGRGDWDLNGTGCGARTRPTTTRSSCLPPMPARTCRWPAAPRSSS